MMQLAQLARYGGWGAEIQCGGFSHVVQLDVCVGQAIEGRHTKQFVGFMTDSVLFAASNGDMVIF